MTPSSSKQTLVASGGIRFRALPLRPQDDSTAPLAGLEEQKSGGSGVGSSQVSTHIERTVPPGTKLHYLIASSLRKYGAGVLPAGITHFQHGLKLIVDAERNVKMGPSEFYLITPPKCSSILEELDSQAKRIANAANKTFDLNPVEDAKPGSIFHDSILTELQAAGAPPEFILDASRKQLWVNLYCEYNRKVEVCIMKHSKVIARFNFKLEESSLLWAELLKCASHRLSRVSALLLYAPAYIVGPINPILHMLRMKEIDVPMGTFLAGLFYMSASLFTMGTLGFLGFTGIPFPLATSLHPALFWSIFSVAAILGGYAIVYLSMFIRDQVKELANRYIGWVF